MFVIPFFIIYCKVCFYCFYLQFFILMDTFVHLVLIFYKFRQYLEASEILYLVAVPYSRLIQSNGNRILRRLSSREISYS